MPNEVLRVQQDRQPSEAEAEAFARRRTGRFRREENMMNKDQALGVITDYGALIARALDVVSEAPHWTYISEKVFAQLEIDGENAILHYPELESGSYDSGDYIVNQCVTFPVRLLFLPDEEFKAWKVAEKAAYEVNEQRRRATAVADKERQERAALAALKAKYGE